MVPSFNVIIHLPWSEYITIRVPGLRYLQRVLRCHHLFGLYLKQFRKFRFELLLESLQYKVMRLVLVWTVFRELLCFFKGSLLQQYFLL